MLEALSIMLMLAESPSQTTVPRRVETPTAPPPTDRPRTGDGPFETADPLFDKPLTATDDAAFVLSAVESGRQGVSDARAAETGLTSPALREAAAKISQQQEVTLKKLEAIAQRKGWRLPESNPGRTGSVPVTNADRTHANFIVHQISYHQTTLAQYRAQLSGNGDAELKRALRDALPGYQKNLQMLLGLKL
jgi:predicted outer membrane protein